MAYIISGEDRLGESPDFRCVGREAELKTLASVLTRRRASSVILTGSSGVGCTTICLGLTAWKNDKDNPAPFDVASKRVFWLDTDGLFSYSDAAAVNAEFDKIRSTLASVSESVLVIEDATDFFNAMKNGGFDHFINALMTMVKRGETQLIIEVKDTLFDGLIKMHSDMTELFTVIEVREPSSDDLKRIVTDSAAALTGHHRIRVGEDAIDAAMELTNKYRSFMNSAQPTRAINLLDRAMSSYRMSSHSHMDPRDEATLAGVTAVMRSLEDKLIGLEESLRVETERIEESADGQKKKIGSFSRMTLGGGVLTQTQLEMTEKIDIVKRTLAETKRDYDSTLEKVNESIVLSKGHVTSQFATMTGIPAEKLNQDEREKLRELEGNLLKRIFGQDDAVRHVAGMVKTSRVGARKLGRPRGACMFMGPSGVGKTEMAKALAVNLFGDEKALFRLDMSEYMEKHAVAKLIGAPPGYEGFEAGGILTNGIRRQPVCVLLLDEIEKAHPDVFNVFLQILGDGRLTDNVGRLVSFEDVYVLCTTNIGQQHYLNKKLTHEQAQAETLADLDKVYRPEFLNRFGGRKDIIQFTSLSLEVIQRIVNRELDDIAQAYTVEGISVQRDQNEINEFCKKNYDPKTGARGLPGFLRSALEPQLADVALSKDPSSVVVLKVRYDKKSNKLQLEVR